MNKHKNNRKFVFGFMSFGDFGKTLFGYKTPVLNLICSIIATILKIVGFIYSSPVAIGILFFVMLLDWGTGVYKAIKLKKFNSFTFQRMLINIFFTMLVIAVAYQMSLVYAGVPIIGFIVKLLPDFLVGGFLFTYFFSVIENLAAIDSKLIPPKMLKWLRVMLDLDRLVPEFFKSKGVELPDPKNEENESNPE